MARFTASSRRCDVCLNSRAVVSENGVHFVCGLTEKKNLDCLMGVKDSYDGYSEKTEVAREIFEEIYNTMNSVYGRAQRSCVGMHGDNPETMRLIGRVEGITRLGDAIAELKKKYTEVE